MAVFAATSQVNLAANLEGSEEWIAIVLLAAVPASLRRLFTQRLGLGEACTTGTAVLVSDLAVGFEDCLHAP